MNAEERAEINRQVAGRRHVYTSDQTVLEIERRERRDVFRAVLVALIVAGGVIVALSYFAGHAKADSAPTPRLALEDSTLAGLLPFWRRGPPIPVMGGVYQCAGPCKKSSYECCPVVIPKDDCLKVMFLKKGDIVNCGESGWIVNPAQGWVPVDG